MSTDTEETPITIGEVMAFNQEYNMVCPPTVEGRDRLIGEIENGDWDEPPSGEIA